MVLAIPNIDDRRYRELLADAMARISVHNPEWTHHADSDPGVTMLQLFAFMTESMLYRANLVPERNRLKFLRLLGVPLMEARPARGMVTLTPGRGRPVVSALNPGLEVRAGTVPFRTVDGLEALPIDAAVFFKAPIAPEREAEVRETYEQAYVGFADDPRLLQFYETTPFVGPMPGGGAKVLDVARDTVDGCVWMALLARSAAQVAASRDIIANRRLSVGVVPVPPDGARVLGGAATAAVSEGSLVFELPRVEPLGRDLDQRVARYAPLPARASGAVLVEPGVVELTLPAASALGLWPDLEPGEPGVGSFPPSLEEDEVAARIITWVRVSPAGRQLTAQLSWIGINAARVTQQATVAGEVLGEGTGEPDQARALVSTPVIPESVELRVGSERWSRIDDLAAAPPESEGANAQVFTIDRASGQVSFGNGLAGARPRRAATIVVSYAYGGGVAGNVGPGAISSASALPAGTKVENPVPTWGGTEAESVAQAERRIPATLRHANRLVTKSDFDELVARTPGVEVGRAIILPEVHPAAPLAIAPGAVTVLVIPLHDVTQPDAPRPDPVFLDAVCAHLEPRRLVTTELHVRGPDYVGVTISIGLSIIPGHDTTQVTQAVTAALRQFLSPLSGGFDESGWVLARAVDAAELSAVAAREPGVAKVSGLLLGDGLGAGTAVLPLGPLALPRIVGLGVRVGDPRPLAELRADAPAPSQSRVPVPVLPKVC